MKRQYFITPAVNESHILAVAAEKTRDGDDCFAHYHGQGQTCTEKCHHVELPKEDKGDVL